MIRIGKYHIIEYHGKKLDVTEAKYPSGRIALQATDHETGEPFDVLTVNIPAYDKDFPESDMIYLNVNHVPGILDTLQKAGLVDNVYDYIWSGYCTYPVVRWIG